MYPISTDTAALLGVLALVGPRCPDQLRVFLLALAIVDDIGAVLAIALFYTDEVDVVALLLAWDCSPHCWGCASCTSGGPRFTWRSACAMWLAVLRSGVHPSVVGVAMGLLVNAYAPRRYDIARVQVTGRSFLVDPTPDRAAAAQAAVTEAVSPNERLQLRIQPWSSYVIVPLFVLANAGVLLTAETLRAAGTSPITWGIVAGLVVGKPIVEVDEVRQVVHADPAQRACRRGSSRGPVRGSGLLAHICEWQFMQVLVGGMPANDEVSTDVWQYRQSMPSSPTPRCRVAELRRLFDELVGARTYDERPRITMSPIRPPPRRSPPAILTFARTLALR